MTTSILFRSVGRSLLPALSGAASGAVVCTLITLTVLNRRLPESSPLHSRTEDHKKILEKAARIGFIFGAVLGVMGHFCSVSATRGAILGLICAGCCVLLPSTIASENKEKLSWEKILTVGLSSLAIGAAIGSIPRD